MVICDSIIAEHPTSVSWEMDGLLGYPRRKLISLFIRDGIVLNQTAEPIISRPPDAVQRLLPRLSQDSLHQLERNAKEPTAAHKASRVRNWVQDLSAAVNPILDATVKPYQNDLCGPTQGPTQSAGRSGQPSIHSNTVSRMMTRDISNHPEVVSFFSQLALTLDYRLSHATQS